MFKHKNTIMSKAEAVVDSARKKALDELNATIESMLDLAEQKAQLGQDPFPTETDQVPSFFIGVKGFAEIPQEVLVSLHEAGYSVEYRDGNCFRLR